MYKHLKQNSWEDPIAAATRSTSSSRQLGNGRPYIMLGEESPSPANSSNAGHIAQTNNDRLRPCIIKSRPLPPVMCQCIQQSFTNYNILHSCIKEMLYVIVYTCVIGGQTTLQITRCKQNILWNRRNSRVISTKKTYNRWWVVYLYLELLLLSLRHHPSAWLKVAIADPINEWNASLYLQSQLSQATTPVHSYAQNNHPKLTRLSRP